MDFVSLFIISFHWSTISFYVTGDIIIERWTPYVYTVKRKINVQRAEAAKAYPAPRNVIIQYEPVRVRVVRQFQRLGVIQENPTVYFQRWGAQLLDAQTLLQQARAHGVVEDIVSINIVSFVCINMFSFSYLFSLLQLVLLQLASALHH